MPPQPIWFQNSPAWIGLKSNYAKFGVSNLFFKSYRRKTFWGVGSPPLVKEGLRVSHGIDISKWITETICPPFFNILTDKT